MGNCLDSVKQQMESFGSNSVEFVSSERLEEMRSTLEEIKRLSPNPAAIDEMWKTIYTQKFAEMKGALNQKKVTIDGHTLRFNVKIFGEKPATGYALVIGMHGGGGVEPEVNDEQFSNHKELYDFDENAGLIWLTARSCENVSDMWHKPYIRKMWEFLIQAFYLDNQININRVYLTGFSAGGDGAYHLAPRMAPRLAGVSMSAGHPNGISLASVRNIVMTLDMGELDTDYDRAQICEEYGRKLDQYQKQDPEGYEHKWQIRQGKEHWMDGEEIASINYLLKKRRRVYPNKLVWQQNDDEPIKYFNWLELDDDQINGKSLIRAQFSNNVYSITTNDVSRLNVRVSHAMVDLSRPVTVTWNGKQVFNGIVQVNNDAISKSISLYADPYEIYVASIPVNRP